MIISRKKVQTLYAEREELRAQLEGRQNIDEQEESLRDFQKRRLDELREQTEVLSRSLDASVEQTERARKALLEGDKLRKEVCKERDMERQKAEALVLLLFKLQEKTGEDREEYLEKIFRCLPAVPTMEDLAGLLEDA